MMFGENIRAYRAKLNLTQEQLGEKIGVSAQAVSKWENDNALPDTALLPDLADALAVSVDALFGRRAASEGDAIRALYDYFAAQKEIDFPMIWEMLYHAHMITWSGFEPFDPSLPTKHSRCQYFRDDGFCHAVYGDDHAVLVAAPKPAGGWADIFTDNAAIVTMLAALADTDTRRALRWLGQHTSGYRFLFPVLMRDAAIPPEAEEKVRENLLAMKLLSAMPIVIDGEEQMTYHYWAKPQFAVIWLLLEDFAQEKWFNYQTNAQSGPLLRRNEDA